LPLWGGRASYTPEVGRSSGDKLAAVVEVAVADVGDVPLPVRLVRPGRIKWRTS